MRTRYGKSVTPAKLGFDASDVLKGNCIKREYEWFDREAAVPLGCVVTLSSSVRAMCPRSVLIMAPRRVKMALLTTKQRELINYDGSAEDLYTDFDESSVDGEFGMKDDVRAGDYVAFCQRDGMSLSLIHI